ncbi:hypothetical protein QYF36_001395 [Acer negundo]|nr:hypothetical protein QYF36_001395 [Acer negundo]
MNCISWYVSGVGNPWTFRALSDLKRNFNPDVLLLMETKAKNSLLESYRESGIKRTQKKRRRRFHFEACWADELDCRDLLSKSWGNPDVRCDVSVWFQK